MSGGNLAADGFSSRGSAQPSATGRPSLRRAGPLGGPGFPDRNPHYRVLRMTPPSRGRLRTGLLGQPDQLHAWAIMASPQRFVYRNARWASASQDLRGRTALNCPSLLVVSLGPYPRRFLYGVRDGGLGVGIRVHSRAYPAGLPVGCEPWLMRLLFGAKMRGANCVGNPGAHEPCGQRGGEEDGADGDDD